LLKNQPQKVCKIVYTCGLILIPHFSELFIRCCMKLTEKLYGIFDKHFLYSFFDKFHWLFYKRKKALGTHILGNGRTQLWVTQTQLVGQL
jgi:hypothetical protein